MDLVYTDGAQVSRRFIDSPLSQGPPVMRRYEVTRRRRAVTTSPARLFVASKTARMSLRVQTAKACDQLNKLSKESCV
ncbi:hypothetical protein EVAR_74747_1 [Eumeta japonica]|uniref:Uncharacterized protein n=1 Tax=Eumeta variegata TaxID=151549 RepID=A0A4C1SPR5_EUMVA|nr:hypothetical protein EVAR_74747_1 [Eumeta japonica]